MRRLCGAAAVLLATVLLGCDEAGTNPCRDSDRRPYSAPTAIGALYDSCFTESGVFRGGGEVDGVLYVETHYLPSISGIEKLVLTSIRPDPLVGEDRVDLFFTGSLESDVDPGIAGQTHWKVRIHRGRVAACSTCVDGCGLVPRILLQSEAGQLEFVRDQEDTIQVQLEFKRR